jgi:UDP-N-acetylglucosamine:LPS N-acetylglucosamine transferase
LVKIESAHVTKSSRLRVKEFQNILREIDMAENILLFFSDTGRGHRSATEAVEDALQLVAQSEFPGRQFNLVAEPVAEKSHPVNMAFVQLYNLLLQHGQHLMKYYYGILHVLKPYETEMGYHLVKDYLKRQMLHHSPSVVVSMHPMTNHYTHRVMKELGLAGDVKLVIVITDPNKNLWKAWACSEADIIIAPNELVREQLIEWHVPESRIRVMGMPVSPDFLKPPGVSREEFLRPLGLSAARPTLCINAGWAGGGNMLAAYRALQGLDSDLQVLFLCGHNRSLYEKARQEACLSKIPTAVLPFHDRMPDLMSAVDAMVTKAGGLTTYECIARRLPMIVDVTTPPMPQEAGTVELLVEQGLAVRLENPQDLPALVRDIHYKSDRLSSPLPEKYCLNATEAVFEIARTILQSSVQLSNVKSQVAGKLAKSPQKSD